MSALPRVPQRRDFGPLVSPPMAIRANEGAVGQSGPRRYRQSRPCAAPQALEPEAARSSCWIRKCSLNQTWRLPGQIP